MAYAYPVFFEIGFLRIQKGKEIRNLACEDITVSLDVENILRYTCDLTQPIGINPSRRKFNFTIRKPKFMETDYFFVEALYGGDFQLLLYRLVRDEDWQKRRQYEQRQIKAKENESAQKILTSFMNPITGPYQLVTEGAKYLASKAGYPDVYVKDRGPIPTTNPKYAKRVGDMWLQHVLTLHHCYVDSISFGNFDGTRTVNEEINGVAEYFSYPPGMAGFYSAGDKGDEMNLR